MQPTEPREPNVWGGTAPRPPARPQQWDRPVFDRAPVSAPPPPSDGSSRRRDSEAAAPMEHRFPDHGGPGRWQIAMLIAVLALVLLIASFVVWRSPVIDIPVGSVQDLQMWAYPVVWT